MAAEPVGILLCAGRGTRFDATGRASKLLVEARRGPHVGAPLAVAAARTLRSVLHEVVAVVRPAHRPEDRDLHRLLRAAGCRLSVCRNADLGMGTSLAHGVQASAGAGGWIVALADMPAIRSDTVQAITDRVREGALTAAPAYLGQRGHPVGFAAALRTELLALGGDIGARPLLARHPPQLVEVDDPGVLYDIDTKEDAQ